VLIVRRSRPPSANSQATSSFAKSAGQTDQKTIDAVRQVFIDYFDKVYETYGRKVVFKDFTASGGSTQGTQEAEGQGQQAACADADTIANQVHAFGESGEPNNGSGGGSAPFSVCAAQQHLMEFNGAGYYDESFYRQLDPFVWNITMECQRIAHQVAEYIGKRLAGKTARWAGDAVTKSKVRRLGTYVPNNDSYQRCVDIFQHDLRTIYHTDPGDRFNYVLDVSRFPDQASQAIVQFHTAGDTTIVLACDPISPVFLTEEARGQQYYPEWLNIGVAANDADTVPRLWDASEITGHLFGMSQISPIQNIWGPSSEAGIMYRHITGKDIPAGTNGEIFRLEEIFNFIQAAGPILTPQNIAAAVHKLPPLGAAVPGGTAPYAWGTWSYGLNPDGTPGGDHTAVIDSREIYWDADGTSPYDGKKGAYVQTMGGKRFTNGQWPRGDPPIYPPNDPQ